MLWRRTRAAGIGAVVLALTSLAALSQNWRRMDYAADGFSVEFSGQVKVSPTAVGEESKDRIVRSTDYLQDDGDSAYIVGATLARYSVEFNKGVEASYGALKCKTTLNDAQLNFARGLARDVSGTDCGDDGALRVEARYYAVGKWFYQVLAIFNRGGNQQAARHFVNSFTVLDN